MARQVAITIDDLPFTGPRLVGRSITENMVRLVQQCRHHRGPIWGFVCARRGEDAALRVWLRGGHKLANHTYSHRAYSKLTVAAYLADVKRNEDQIRRRLGVELRGTYFRYPFLDHGHTATKVRKMAEYLAAGGYQLAPVSLDTVDYRFNASYVAATQKEAVVKHYLTHITEAAQHFESLSRRLYGREIPLIFLAHANVINADHFSRVLQLLSRRGYAFVSLKTALADKAYRQYGLLTPHVPLAGDRNFLNQVALSKGLRIPDPTGDAHFNKVWQPILSRL